MPDLAISSYCNSIKDIFGTLSFPFKPTLLMVRLQSMGVECWTYNHASGDKIKEWICITNPFWIAVAYISRGKKDHNRPGRFPFLADNEEFLHRVPLHNPSSDMRLVFLSRH